MKTIAKIPQLAGMLLLALCISLTAYPASTNFKKAFELASGNFRVQNYEVALPLLIELQEKQPTNANISFMIGVCYLTLRGEHTKAVAYLEAAIKNTSAEHSPWSYKEQSAPEMSLYFLANAYQMNGRFDEAVSLYLDCGIKLIKEKKGVANRKLFNDIHRNIDDCKRQMEQLATPETSDAILYW